MAIRAKGFKVLAVALASWQVAGCGGGDDPPAPVSDTFTVPGSAAAVAAACTALAGKPLVDGSITSAAIVSGEQSGGVSLPENCKVTGKLEARIGVNNVAYATNFEVRLPTTWNRRFYLQGQGGTGGSVVAAYGTNQPTGQAPALSKGFAVVSFDGGHSGSTPVFGLDPKAVYDFAYHSMDIATVAAKSIVNSYYGQAPAYSYAVGCSNGGRQMMELAQRFPNYFDGILAGSATYRLSVSYVDAAWGIQAVHNAAPTDSQGNHIDANAFSQADLNLVAADLLSVLDGKDGLVDGVVSNVAASGFSTYDPGRLQCTGDKTPQCLTSAQVGAMRALFSGAKNSAGQSLYSSWPWDPGLSGSQWISWKLGTSQTPVPNSIKAAFADTSIGYLYLDPPDPNFKALNFNFDTDPQRLAMTGPLLDADNPDLSPFVAHGGKIMWWHGMADPSTPITDVIRYYTRMAAATHSAGAADTYARVFAAPGVGHCGGGPGLDNFPALDALMQWVEKGVAPDSMVATGTAVPGRSRPICPWPQYASYKGSGDVNDAANFVCKM
ncbi:MAG TPA: tannase/feruloyl esterase family alpha/beta hydrolase [Ramlibacter sp.]|uniref:tannase/feruloyl esterase family alpha/beta hydrolase n=1 Tax=Ramlibacter sp. TaxID=1917967 RepID=UPI002BE95D9E|nr:tannase/feruloyl esterase family alpha/beta hydrolase [Ramlibacter sp.]HVZ44006.1 tannase/feruloyl esterase family alpha/beta hydrolase [Ramlibacter sp.]